MINGSQHNTQAAVKLTDNATAGRAGLLAQDKQLTTVCRPTACRLSLQLHVRQPNKLRRAEQ